VAINTLKHGAYLAEKDDHERMRNSHVRSAWNSVKEVKTDYFLRQLTDHHRLLYELISASSGILSGDLWRLYLEACGERNIKPIAVRTHSDYCNKLVETSLVQAKRAPIQGKVREFVAAN